MGDTGNLNSKFVKSLVRSGLAWKHHIDIGAGVVDEDYRGNIGKLSFHVQ